MAKITETAMGRVRQRKGAAISSASTGSVSMAEALVALTANDKPNRDRARPLGDHPRP
jgi:hypothetical protein